MKRTLFALLLALLVSTKALAQPPFSSASLTSTTCPGTGCLVADTAGAGTIGVQVTGTFTATLQFEQSIDGTNWVAWSVTPATGGAGVTSTTTTGLWSGPSAGIRQIRVRVSAYTDGAAVVSRMSSLARAGGAGGGSSNIWTGTNRFEGNVLFSNESAQPIGNIDWFLAGLTTTVNSIVPQLFTYTSTNTASREEQMHVQLTLAPAAAITSRKTAAAFMIMHTGTQNSSSSIRGVYAEAQHASSGSADEVTGVYSYATNRGNVTSSINTIRGVYSQVAIQHAATVSGSARGLMTIVNTSTGTQTDVARADGVYVQITNAGTATSDIADARGIMNLIESTGSGTFSANVINYAAFQNGTSTTPESYGYYTGSLGGVLKYAFYNSTPGQPITNYSEYESVSPTDGKSEWQPAETQLTCTSGATCTATNLIPAGSVVLGVTIRVTTAITGPATIQIGDGTDVDRWGTGIAMAAGTTTSGADFTITSVPIYPTATSVVLTAVGGGGSFTAGVVRVTVHYMNFTASTS